MSIRQLRCGLIACLLFVIPSLVGAQSYIFCSNGLYFTAYGPSQWWVTVNSQGLCGVYNSLSPASLRWTYNIPYYPSINYAIWDWYGTPYELPYNGHYFAFIDSSVSARTTNARYSLVYNVGSAYHMYLNQALVAESWTRLSSGAGFYRPRNVVLDDVTNECNVCKRVVFDEIKVEY